MNLRRLDRQLLWPEAVPAERLGGWIRQQLQPEGQLLRWAITAVNSDAAGQRWLQVEAVVEVGASEQEAVVQVGAAVEQEAVVQP